jgi:transposase
MDWPPRSPDLNPIEHIWSLIDQRISGIRFNSLTQLEEELARQWNNITTTECLNLIESMPERIRLCLKAKGGYFDY